MTTDAPGPRAGRPRRSEVAALVLTAARDLIRDQGYSRTSVDQIAAAAGVAKTTVYRRWAAKSDLAVDALVDALGPLPTPDGQWPAGLRDTISWLADQVCDPALHRLLVGLLGEAAYDPTLRSQLWLRIRSPYEEVLVARWGVDRAAAHLTFDVVVGSLMQHVTMNGSVPAAMVDAVTDLAAGLLVPSPGSQAGVDRSAGRTAITVAPLPRIDP